MRNKIILMHGFSYMSRDRIQWIRDFLSLFEPALRTILEYELHAMVADTNDSFSKEVSAGDIVIGHEIPFAYAKRLSNEHVRYIDIRVSPVRFCGYDNLFAMGTNDPDLRRILLRARIPDHHLRAEAISLKLSFRYRDLGQFEIKKNALVLFTEQKSDRDSIHAQDPLYLLDYRDNLESLMGSYDNLYYAHRGDHHDEDASFLHGLGFTRCAANMYAILSSVNVKAVAAIRGGILEEARYFGVAAIGLGSVTTPLATDLDSASDDKFVNISPSDALSNRLWSDVLHGKLCGDSFDVHRAMPSPNIVRRALNNWNSSAIGLERDSQSWRELVYDPISSVLDQVRDETDFWQRHSPVQIDRDPDAPIGEWRWFTGEPVKIRASGHVTSAMDYGVLRKTAGDWTIDWQRRQLIDILTLAPDGLSFETRNQYGDGGIVRRMVR